MKAESGHWHVMGPAATTQEQAALDAFRELLPEDGITTAWANLTFIDNNGRSAEVDVLLLTRSGLYVVELKGWHGTIRGDSQRWDHNTRNVENPWLATDRKAKKLAGILRSVTKNGSEQKAIPFVSALVVLHGRESIVELEGKGRTGVVALDGYNVTGKPKKLDQFSGFLANLPANPHHIVDFQRAKQIRKLCERADFKAIPKQRMFGDYKVSQATPIAEGPDWQDVLVEHPFVSGVRQRLRLYDVDPKASASDRTRVEQMARREYQLTYGIQHEGIAVPGEFKVTDDGPALVFPYDNDEMPLDAYLASEKGQDLDFDQRVALVQRLAETLRFAHERHLIHRALAAKRVWVKPGKGEIPRLTIRDWYSGQKERDTDASSRWTAISQGATDLLGLGDHEDWIYLAPEARHDARDLPGIPLDVYGLGTLSYLILTGRRPADTFAELEQRLAETHGLDPRAAAQVPDEVADVVTLATSDQETARPATIAEFLDLFRDAYDTVRGAADVEEHPQAPDPLEAVKSDIVADRFIVVSRRGEGSSGVALAVNDTDAPDPEREVILKLARSESAENRLAAEAEILRALDHRRVVRLIDGPIEVDQRKGLILSDAGKTTLASRLATEGRATLGQLQQFGGDLLEAMAYLETKGVFHRDIKPANLGVIPDPGKKHPTLVLFDFSLATEPLDNIRSGTPRYVDPYLGRGRRQRYDRAAELYAVAVTLFEMATGQQPWWEGGLSGPADSKAAPIIEPTSFEPAVAQQLTELFRKALHPDAKARFASADELALSWQQIFIELDAGEETAEANDELAGKATLETRLAEAGLSARARSGLARFDLVTVGDLLGIPPMKITTIRGLGESYRKEIQRRIREWRARLSDTEHTHEAGERPGVERTVGILLDALSGESRVEMRALLGLTADMAETEPSWPSMAEAAQQLGRTRDQVVRTVDKAVETWTARDTTLTSVRDDAVAILAREGRVLTLPALAWSLAAQRGSLLDGPERARYAAALLRAAYELDSREIDSSVEYRRRPNRPALIALHETVDADESGPDRPTAETLIGAADELGRAAEQLVKKGVVPLVTAAAALRAEVADAGGESLPADDRRLISLAAEASGTADVSGYGELYPVDLSPVTAIEIALSGKPGRQVHQDAIRRSVAARFPRVQLPATAHGLDALVAQAIPGMVRQGSIYEQASSTHSSVTGTATMLTPTNAPEAAGRLQESLRRHGAITLCTTPKRYVRAARSLPEAFDLDVLDIAQLVVTATRAKSNEVGADWPFILGVDSRPHDDPDRATLGRLVRDAVEPVLAERLTTDRPLLITNAGPLIRYGLGSHLAGLLDVGTPRPAARWLLVAMSGNQAAPQLDGQPVPVGPSGWVKLSSDITPLLASALNG